MNPYRTRAIRRDPVPPLTFRQRVARAERWVDAHSWHLLGLLVVYEVTLLIVGWCR
jgi:hypothetical protein